MNEIEQYYEKFRAELAYPFEYHNIDYIGVCLDADDSVPCRFKMYWSDHCSAPFDHWLTRWLKEHRMLQYIETVEHSGRTGKYQSDMRIGSRTDSNMQHLFSALADHEPAFSQNEELIRTISKMPVTTGKNYLYASLYFLGAIYTGTDSSEMLKFHWINRFCQDPDALSENIWYNDSIYLEYLRALPDEHYLLPARHAEAVLKACSCHLWMTGLDVMGNGWKKYKLYVKYFHDLCPVLSGLFSQEAPQRDGIQGEDLQGDGMQGKGLHALAGKADRLCRWLRTHPELEPAGCAFCLDTDGKYSVNLYYGIQESYFENGHNQRQ